ncbi:septum formation inhibitor Maf [Galbibacter pacificus]|uniref:Septum formation inhibitor Maf n=1 Tax=Galbibacter pacificus TaxID=2996052 RepID=A0ABT6FQW5_9FLAO|nr:septum formation inhibitor Maf [Galbibacter pacificus]MDG3585660.1 septum formation inhibitor Maf [Galbibacter pacificus]
MEITLNMKFTKYIFVSFVTLIVISFIYWKFTNYEKGRIHYTTSEEFNDYWYSGEAEITSYQLLQARYGELRQGKATLIYVTEPFLKEKQVKPNNPNKRGITVLKLNTSKNFVTGIYPYHIMNSTFYPLSYQGHAIKIATSVTEWCGQAYTQLNNRNLFEITSHSYFENEADATYTLPKNILEDEIWAQIRVAPDKLPIGEQQIIPSLAYLRLKHIETKAFTAMCKVEKNKKSTTYSIHYPDLERTLAITFQSAFPYAIEEWEESYKSGFGKEAKIITSSAKKIKTIRTAYWEKNATSDVSLRDTLGL